MFSEFTDIRQMSLYNLKKGWSSNNLPSTRMSTVARLWLQVEGYSRQHWKVNFHVWFFPPHPPLLLLAIHLLAFQRLVIKLLTFFISNQDFCHLVKAHFPERQMGVLPSKLIQSSSLVFKTLNSATNYIFRYRERPQCIDYSTRDVKEWYFFLNIRRIWWMMLATTKTSGVTVAEIAMVYRADAD